MLLKPTDSREIAVFFLPNTNKKQQQQQKLTVVEHCMQKVVLLFCKLRITLNVGDTVMRRTEMTVREI